MGILDDAIREHLELKRRHGADNAEVSRQEREILGGEGAPLEPQGSPGFDAAPAYEAPPAAELEPQYADELVIDEPEALPIPEPLAGSPLEAEAAPAPAPAPSVAPEGDLFPGTGELLAAASESPAAPARPLAAPAPSGADSETAARSGARRLSDDELAAWRRRLSERADRLAAQRPGTEPTPPATAPSTPAAGAAPVDTSKRAGAEPPSYWSGNTTGTDAGAPPPTPAPTPRPTPRVEPPAGAGVPVDFFDAGDAAESAFAPEAAPEPIDADHDVLDETPDFLEETPEHDRMWFEQRPPRDFDFG
ncbi:MAG: hypothetical protein Q7T55_06615 [Solirubrobacteraceae bacterium]|nr:hypothetical protein [Solirubrobacteraceae bacterium]